MSDEPIQFTLTFTLPDYNALKRHVAGGGRAQLDLAETTVRAFEDMAALAVAEHGVVFEAVVFAVKAQPQKIEDAKSEEKHGFTKWHRD